MSARRQHPMAKIALLAAIAAAAAQAPGRRLAAGVGRWTDVGPWVSSVSCLAVDPAHPKIVYAGTSGGGGVWKSVDGGATWSASFQGLPSPSFVSALAIDPLNTSILYLAGSAGGFKSVNGGTTWAPISLGPPDAQELSALAIDPSNSLTIYASGSSGVAKSLDGGVSWTPASNGLPAAGAAVVGSLRIDPAAPQTLYAGLAGLSGGIAGGGVWKSVDGAKSWQPSGLQSDPIGVLALAPGHPSVVYAAGYISLWKSRDGGMTWSKADRGLNGRSSGINAVAVDPASPSTLLAGTSLGIFKSTDGAATWGVTSRGLGDPEVRALAFGAKRSGVVFAGTTSGLAPGGVYKSGNGGATWAASGRGVETVDTPAFNQSGSTIFAASVGALIDSVQSVDTTGFFVTHDGGTTWSPVTGLEGKGVNYVQEVLIDPLVPDTVYALGTSSRSGTNYRVFRSRDGGATWSRLAVPQALTALEIDPRNSDILYAFGLQGAGILRSADGGASWTLVAGACGPQCVLQAIDPTNPNNVYAESFQSVNGTPRAVLYKSADRGLTWSTWSAPGLVDLFTLAVDPQSSTTLYGLAGAAVQKSVDGGASWSVVYPLPQTAGVELLLAPSTPTTVYVSITPYDSGLPSDLVRSTDGGATWSTVPNAGLGGHLAAVAFDRQDPQRLIAWSFESGLQTQTVGAPPAPCVPGPATLCLGGGRFQVTASWQTSTGNGQAGVLPITTATGALWFFSAENLELVVKVLDGCAANGSHWFFACGLTSVGVTVTVTDTQSGAVQIYSNPADIPFPPIYDTGAFGDCP